MAILQVFLFLSASRAALLFLLLSWEICFLTAFCGSLYFGAVANGFSVRSKKHEIAILLSYNLICIIPTTAGLVEAKIQQHLRGEFILDFFVQTRSVVLLSRKKSYICIFFFFFLSEICSLSGSQAQQEATDWESYTLEHRENAHKLWSKQICEFLLEGRRKWWTGYWQKLEGQAEGNRSYCLLWLALQLVSEASVYIFSFLGWRGPTRSGGEG